MQAMIEMTKLTKAYKQERGVFGMKLQIRPGEIVGIVGQNGAGKTTTMRMLMGFIKPTSGHSEISGLDTWQSAAKTKALIGYVPGEIAFPDTKSGATFLKMQLELLRRSQDVYVNELIQRFKIDLTADIKRMSKGMKQKTALVCAFMTQAPLLLLDEPTTGLDPVMRETFIDLLLQVKTKGTTVFLSSHMFNELERTCDRILFLKNGQVIDQLDQKKVTALHQYQRVMIQGTDEQDYNRLMQTNFELVDSEPERYTVTLLVNEKQTAPLLDLLQTIELQNISFSIQNLDNYFEKELATH
ncbi:ABC transporter ATP-binding protein [Loigolactobacillus binensis]|uniref:ABC transporter ATP-binding protein n=1 Tax=Loigolactobacillus binensis TaxID=2559922 RepID=A0ABW3EH21_9LACO|nr:ATP-binding cassette domain-containing protein [Loigolactobacillus binensis]